MPQAQSRDDFRPEDHPLVWFGDLLASFERGDFGRAALCQAELGRLGWRVDRKTRRKPRAEGGGS